MNPAEPIALQSTTLASAAYDQQQFLLQLEFRNGSIYQYFQVPAHVYQDLLTAESKGQYFNRWIRDQFPCSRSR
jgi:hypothetical protein